jgi:quercetin dioxygenase-like cupin family protein
MLLAFQPPMLENEYVLVHMATDQPHAKGKVHRHALDRVMVYLDDGRMRIENVNGPVENQVWKAGQVAWSPAGGEHTSENVGDRVLHIIEIELKSTVPSGKPFTISPLDPVNVDPKRYRVEFQNSKVRVFRGKYGPHEEGIMHEHVNNRVVVYLKDGELRVTTPDGKTEVKMLAAKSVSWGAAAKHQEHSGDRPVEMVVVELK